MEIAKNLIDVFLKEKDITKILNWNKILVFIFI
jgi:hypothetical protein